MSDQPPPMTVLDLARLSLGRQAHLSTLIAVLFWIYSVSDGIQAAAYVGEGRIGMGIFYAGISLLFWVFAWRFWKERKLTKAVLQSLDSVEALARQAVVEALYEKADSE